MIRASFVIRWHGLSVIFESGFFPESHQSASRDIFINTIIIYQI